MTEGLEAMNPLQIAQSTFERIYQTEMPDDMVALFQEAYQALSVSDNQ